MDKFLLTMVSGLVFVSAPTFAANGLEHAQLGRIQVEADKIEMLSTNELKAWGNVVVTGKDSVIQAQEAFIRKRGALIEVQAQEWVQVEQSSIASPEFDPFNLLDARAAGGEMRLQKEGYVPVRTQGLSTTWWNRSNQKCITVKTSQGRYSDVREVGAAVCKQG